MMINKEYLFPTKLVGPYNLINDGVFYGTEDYTWDFKLHWPHMSIDYVENNTNVNVIIPAGSEEQAEANLAKIARISRLYIMSRVPGPSQPILEYRVAKDIDVLEEVLQFQLEILQTWGGYNSLYKTDTEGTIGEAAELYFQGSSMNQRLYSYSVPMDKYRKDY